jgi:hypothetical protein
MTIKTINLNEKTVINELTKGSVLKKKHRNDLYMVLEVERSREGDPITNTLYNINLSSDEPINVSHRTPKYNLVSFSTGTLYFDENIELRDLLQKVIYMKFEVVEEVEFKQIR